MSLLKKRKRDKRISFKNDAEVHTVQEDGSIIMTKEQIQHIPFSYIYNRILKLKQKNAFTSVDMYDILETCKTERLSVETILNALIDETHKRIQKMHRHHKVHLGAWTVRRPTILMSILSVMNKTKRDLDMLKDNYDDMHSLLDKFLGSDSSDSSSDSSDSLYSSDSSDGWDSD